MAWKECMLVRGGWLYGAARLTGGVVALGARHGLCLSRGKGEVAGLVLTFAFIALQAICVRLS